MKWFLRHLFVCLQLLAITSQAQPTPTRFRFDHITVNDGLAHSDALCVEQDAEGFIWIGTNDGVNRYDGYTLKKYSLPINAHNGLTGNRTRDLCVDAANQLWVGAKGAGLSLFDAILDRFVNVNRLAHNVVSTILNK